jgi:hypothetical protein
MDDKIYSVKSNAKRDASKAIASGTASAVEFDIVSTEGGFRIAWGARAEDAGPVDADPPPTDAEVHEFRSNAKAAAERMIAKGEAPAPAYTIERAEGGFRVVWGEKTAKASRAGTKHASVVELLQRPEGATISEIQAATGWLPHTARGWIAGTAKRKLGLAVVAEKVDGRGRVYRATVA